MASLNTAARELVLKIVYYGPGLGGKTTSLQALHDAAPPERRGKLVSLATPVDRTLYFDFLPLRLPPLRGLAVRLQLFTVPGQVYFNATRRLVLSGADGVVFVADSQGERIDANLESLENLRENLAEHGRDLATLPHAFSYNKRDLPEVLSIDALDRALNAHRAPVFGTVAPRGDGVQATLDEITRMVLDAYEAQLPEGLAGGRAPTSTSVAESPPSVRISGGEEVETSATSARAPAVARDGDVLASGSAHGTFLADVARIEAAARRPPSREVEGLLGGALARELERLEAGAEPPLDLAGSSGLSFAPLFAPAERALVEQIEQSIAHGSYGDAVGACDAALARILSAVAAVVDRPGAPGLEPSLPLLLGIDGRRYLTFRALVRRARQIGDLGVRDALEAFAFVLETRVAFGQWDALRSAVGVASHPPPPSPAPIPPSVMPPLPGGTVPPPGSGGSAR